MCDTFTITSVASVSQFIILRKMCSTVQVSVKVHEKGVQQRLNAVLCLVMWKV